MHARIEQVLRYLDETLVELRQAVDSVPPDLREQRPGVDRWSAAEVVEHLSLVETRIAQMADAQIAAGRERGLGPETSAASALEAFDADTLMDRNRRVVASASAQPRQGLDMTAAWSALEDARAAVRQAVLSGDGLALGELVVPHSVLGHVNLYHWIAFVGAHELRHAAQIREVASQLAASPPADPQQILSAARAVLLVDWPNPDVPRTLLAAGLLVFGYSPDGYSAIEVAPGTDTLAFRRIDARPEAVDIVNIYRPAEELPGIIQEQVLLSGARTLWLQPPTTSHEARQIAGMYGVGFIEGVDIAGAARATARAAGSQSRD